MSENSVNNTSFLFDEHSFQEEIKSTSEAQSCYTYFVNNLQSYQNQLSDAGLHGDERKEKLRQVWKNLIKSCQRVNYTNEHLERVAKSIGKN
jgi:hypothetical protein